MLDRAGKGLRTAPRDAMISLSSPQGGPRHGLRRAPGARHHRRAARPADRLRPAGAGAARLRHPVHRLASASRSLGLGVIVLFVREPRAPTPARRSRRAASALRAAFALLREPPASAALFVAGAACSPWRRPATRFIYLALQRDARPRHRAVPAAVHRHRADVHAARRARSAASPTASGAARVLLGRLRAPARRLRGCCSAPSAARADDRRRALSCSARSTPRPTAC